MRYKTKTPSAIAFGILTICLGFLTVTACDRKKEIPGTANAPVTSALIITTDYQTGAYSVINPITREAFNSIDMIHQDSVCRFDSITGTPFIIARLGSDAVDTVTPAASWSITGEFSVGAGSNPQDIAVVNSEMAYVALYEKPHLLKVNPITGALLGTVDLSPYADADGIPEVGWLYAMNGKLYVLLQRLSRPQGFLPTDYSSLLILNAITGVVEKELRLAQTNPFGKLRFNALLNRFVIVESGVFTTMQDGMPIDGAIEYFDAETETLSGAVITAQALGGDIVDAVVVSETRGYAVVGVRKGTSAETHVVAFNPTTGEKGKTLLASDTWVFNFIELTPDGSELWVADRSRNAPGIRIFNTLTDVEITQSPIDVGLPPFMICFTESQVGISDSSSDSATETGTAGTDDTDTSLSTDLDSETNTDPVETDDTPRYLDVVVDAPCGDADAAFGDPLLAANGVRGAGDGMGSLDVFSMRFCDSDALKYITLRADKRRILNGPGVDFVVFENGFRVASSPDVFMEPLVIYLSQDGVTWVPFPFDYLHTPETEYSPNPGEWQGFGGIWPVFYHEEDNPVDPFDFELAGGDPFDLDRLPDEGEALEIKRNGFIHMKLMAATSVLNPDTGDYFPMDASSYDGSADLDGVYVRYTSLDSGEVPDKEEDTGWEDTDTGWLDTDTIGIDTATIADDTGTALEDTGTASETVRETDSADAADTDAATDIETDTGVDTATAPVETDADSDGCRDDLMPKNGVCIPRNGFDNYVGLIIDWGNGDGAAICVGYDGPDEISGIAMLQKAGITLELGFNDMAICGMEGVGCSEDGPDGCWCQCSMVEGTDCVYWSYHHNIGDGTWKYSGIGAGIRVLSTGELDGWYWGVGTPEGAPVPGTDWLDAPTPATFEKVCVF